MKKTLDPKMYLPGYEHAIADSWDMDSTLGNILLDIFSRYKKI